MGLLCAPSTTSTSTQAVRGEQNLARWRRAALPCPVLVGEDGQDVAVILQKPDLFIRHMCLMAAEGATDDAGRRIQLHHLLQAFCTDAVQAAQNLGLAGACVEAVVTDLALQLLQCVDHRRLRGLRLRV